MKVNLRHYPDDQPGITRCSQGRGFSYRYPDGSVVTCSAERARIAALAIPPAYEDVWISPYPDGYLLATGRDDKGRKQYIYHEQWRAAREREKFAAIKEIGLVLPRLRRWIGRRLAAGGTEKEAALATALALIERGSLRPGSPSYTLENGSYGATTLLPKHFDQEGSVSVLTYTAKGGQPVEKRIRGTRLAKHLAKQKRRNIPNLIMWLDADGKWRTVLATDLNERLAGICGEGASVKALRTWNGTLAAFRVAQDESRLTKKLMADAAANVLHNTPAIAQQSYIHPDVLKLTELPTQEKVERLSRLKGQTRPGLRVGEGALLALLETK